MAVGKKSVCFDFPDSRIRRRRKALVILSFHADPCQRGFFTADTVSNDMYPNAQKLILSI
jgi:hypothetical protein